MRDFTKYQVWKEAIQIAKKVYELTLSFPSEEKFGLISQMRRCAVSIYSNIAEGCSRSSEKDFVRFIEIAIGSLFELKSQLYLSNELTFINNQLLNQISLELDKIGKHLNSLRNKIKS